MENEIDLTKLVIEIDDELIEEQTEPFQRPFNAYIRIARRLQPNRQCAIQSDPLFKAVINIYEQLYRQKDMSMPPMHVGAFMFRDIFFPLRIPLILGQPAINPVDFLVDISEIQKHWLFSDRQAGLTFFDQAIDLMDFVYGLDDLKDGDLPSKTKDWWQLAKQQLEAAAATLLGSFNKHSVIQNCCMATELLLKGALFANEVTEKVLANKNLGYGHNLHNLVIKSAEHLENFDYEVASFAVKQLPDYVESRYGTKNFSRVDLGNFLMISQFIGGEILRQFSDRNFRIDFLTEPNNEWDLSKRTFPKVISPHQSD